MSEESEKAVKKAAAEDKKLAVENAKMCVYSTADGRANTVSVAEGEKLLKGKDWVDSPAKVKGNGSEK